MRNRARLAILAAVVLAAACFPPSTAPQLCAGRARLVAVRDSFPLRSPTRPDTAWIVYTRAECQP